MTRQDTNERRISFLEQQVAAVVAKVDSLVEESKQQREDIREIRSEIRDALKHLQGLTIAAVVGIAAITVATWAFMWTTANNIAPPTPPPQTTQYQSTEQKTN